MTFKRGINSKYKSRDFLQRGLKSMFPEYPTDPTEAPEKPSAEEEKKPSRK